MSSGEKSRFPVWLKRMGIGMLVLLLACIILPCSIIIYANAIPMWSAHGRTFRDASQIPEDSVGLVFGTSDRVGGQENLYFRYRIEAACKAWKSGRLKTIIVSGDNRAVDYNEPDKMKQALIRCGIPSKRIVCDFAGLRTLDSVVRAKEVFGVSKIVFISQRFQNERAIYLAKAHGIDAYGFDAQDVQINIGLKTKLREVGARVRMWLDVNFLHTRPRHLGDKETLPE